MDTDFIKLGNFEGPMDEEPAVSIEMWYDRHRKEWVIYPVDANGNQLAPARFGFGKREALSIRADIAAELGLV